MTMSDALYKKLKDVEPTIAEAYKAAVKGNVINHDALMAILTKVVDPNGLKKSDISPEEAQALVLIIDSGELTDSTKKSLLAAIRHENGLNSLLNGTGVELAPNDPELARFHSVFAIKHTGNLKFYSKGTSLTYSPSQYQAVAQLVKGGKIKVVKVMDRGLFAKAVADAIYVPDGGGTFFFAEHPGEKDFFLRAPDIVHEATHAVQDWFDISSTVTVRYVEADAYIAQAVVDAKNAPQVLKAAAKFVLDGKATKGNEAWEKAYEAAAVWVDNHADYKDRANDASKMAEGASESTEFAKVIKALEKPAGKSAPKK
jgi:hypothetical protein